MDKKFLDSTGLTYFINKIVYGITSPKFSTGSTYTVGDFVIYTGNLYRCTTAVTVAGAWSASKWVQTTVKGEIKALNTNLGGLSFAKDADGKWGYKVAGADPVIPFSSIKIRHTVTNTTPGQYQNWIWSRKILPSPEVQIAGGSLRVDTYAGPANININIIKLVSRNGATGIVTYQNRIAYPITVTPSSGSQFTVAAGGTFTDGGVVSAEYISQNVDELRSICTNIT